MRFAGLGQGPPRLQRVGLREGGDVVDDGWHLLDSQLGPRGRLAPDGLGQLLSGGTAPVLGVTERGCLRSAPRGTPAGL